MPRSEFDTWTVAQSSLLSKNYGKIPFEDLKAKINSCGTPRSAHAIRAKAEEKGLTVNYYGLKEFSKPLGVHYSTVKRAMVELQIVKNSSEKVRIPIDSFEETMEKLKEYLNPPENFISLKEVADQIGYAYSILVRQKKDIFSGAKKFGQTVYVSKEEVESLKKKLKTKSLNQIASEKNKTLKPKQAEAKRNYRMDAVSKFIEIVAPYHENLGLDRRMLAIDSHLAKTVINKNVPTYYVIRNDGTTFFVPKQQYSQSSTEDNFKWIKTDISFLISSHTIARVRW